MRDSDRITLPMMAYYAAFSLYVFSYIVGYTKFDFGHIALIQFAAFALLVFKWVSGKYDAKQILVCAFVVMLGVVSWRVTSERSLLAVSLFVVASKDIDVSVLARISIVVLGSVTLFTVVCSSLNIIDSADIPRDIGPRYSLGFSHPNRFGSTILALVCSYAVLRLPAFALRDAAVYLVSFLVVLLVSDSRTSALMIAVTAMLAIISSLSIKQGRTRFLLLGSIIAFVAIVVSSMLFMVVYNPDVEWMRDFDKLLSGRLALWHSYFVEYPPSLLGHSYLDYSDTLIYKSADGTEGWVIDNAYVKLIILYGILPTALFLCGYAGIFVSALQRGSFDIVVFGALVYAFVGFAEWQAMHFAMNYYLIGFGFLIFGTPALHLKSTVQLRSY